MTVGVLGAGQLGRMLALAGYALGLKFRFFDTSADGCAGDLGSVVAGRFDDRKRLLDFAQGLDVVTSEFENVPASALEAVASIVPCRPLPRAFELAQDRLLEKRLFQRLSIPTVPFAPVDSEASLGEALGAIGCPAVLKTRCLGYDGKGQAVVKSAAEAVQAFSSLPRQGLILEGFVSFDFECSLIAVRAISGETRCYPLVENIHRQGILRLCAPRPEDPLQSLAQDYVQRLLEELNYTGVLAVEFFVRGGELLANEFAPRVHNSGHWTIEGAETSQFENHLRAICGLPLGSTKLAAPNVMLNIVGTEPDAARLLGIAGAHLHRYNKTPREGRKIGHLTLRDSDWSRLPARLREAAAALGLDEVAESFLAPRDRHGCRTST